MIEFESDWVHTDSSYFPFLSSYSGTFKWMYRCTSAFHKIRSIIFMNAWHIINGAAWDVRGCILWNSSSSGFVRHLAAYFTVVRPDMLYDLSLIPITMEVSQDMLVGYLQDYKPQHNENDCIHHSYSSDYDRERWRDGEGAREGKKEKKQKTLIINEGVNQ